MAFQSFFIKMHVITFKVSTLQVVLIQLLLFTCFLKQYFDNIDRLYLKEREMREGNVG